ncbi:hypothetical protein HYV43_05580 [Candidatus Micrarchaeota archaeon]|nr:hypothetical protein [Candidatus Micrarchaeota archaeon]
MAAAKKKDEIKKPENTDAKTKPDSAKDAKAESAKTGFSFSIPPLALDDAFKLKAPLLVLMLLLFAFAGYLFQAASLHVTDLVDVQRMQFSAAKLYSLSFILFLVLFALVLALSMHFGYGQNWLMSLLALAPTGLAAIVLGVMFPPYFAAFLAFALTASAASFFASRAAKMNLSGAWNVVGRALLVLALLAFVLTFMKVSANSQYYSDRFLNSAVAMAPDLGGQVADAVKNVEVDEAFLRGAISKETFASSISTESVQSAIETIPGLSSFNASVRQKWAETVKTSLTSDAAYNQFITLGTASLKKAQANLADQFKETATNEAVTAGALAQVKKLPAFKQATDNFGIILAFMVLSVVGVMNVAIKILATILAWGLGKIAFA